MVTRIDVEVCPGATSSRVLIDGAPAGSRRVVTAVQSDPDRSGVWIDAVAQFEVEVYLNGRLEARVGPRSAETERRYEQLGPPPSERPASPRPVELRAPDPVDRPEPVEEASADPVPTGSRRWSPAALAGWAREQSFARTLVP